MHRSFWVRQVPFVLASAVAYALCQHIRLPFSNPANIVGSLAHKHFNPANNVVRFLLFVGAPLLFLGGIWCLLLTRIRLPWAASNRGACDFSSPHIAVKWMVPILILSFLPCVIMALNIPTFHGWGLQFDPFHDGETLGTSISLLNGEAPYKDVVFAHGVFQDPLRSVVAFKLFHRSIGAVRALDSIIKILCFIALFAFLLVLYDGRCLYAYLTLLVLVLAIYWGALVIPSRDVMTFSFLLAAAVVLRSINKSEGKLSAVESTALVLFSFLPIATMAYSIDRGFYIIVPYAVMLPLIAFYSHKRLLYRVLVFSAIGVGLGTVFAGFLLHWEFRAFIDFAFITIPRYKELYDGMIYPFHYRKFLLVVLIISWNVYLVFARLLAAIRPDIPGAGQLAALSAWLRTHLMEICLVLLSLCFFRTALGRSDWEHVQYSCGIAYVLSCYLFIRYGLNGWLQKTPKAAGRVAVFVASIVVAGCLFGTFRIGREHLLARNFPVNKPDAEFMRSDYQQGLDFLTANLSKEDSFFTMTSEGVWYYLLDRPCPSRFPVAWFAQPPLYQQEVVRDLQMKRVKIILYKNSHGVSHIDGFSAGERLPVVDAYIRENYQPYAVVAGNEFWIRKM